jgi:hypothetical protein
MKKNQKIGSCLVVAMVFGGVLAGTPANAAPTSYEQSSAMSGVLNDPASTESGADEMAPQGVVGVARAMAIGFKAAKAPQAVGNMARLASVLGFMSATPINSPDVETAYFDR